MKRIEFVRAKLFSLPRAFKLPDSVSLFSWTEWLRVVKKNQVKPQFVSCLLMTPIIKVTSYLFYLKKKQILHFDIKRQIPLISY